MFPTEISENWRVVRTSYGQGDYEWTIPLGSWRKGGGLEGSKGHVYLYGQGWAGVWIKTSRPKARMAELKEFCSNLVPMQIGDGEGTFRVPMADLPLLLPHLKAKRRFRASEAQLAAAAKALKSSSMAGKIHLADRQKGQNGPGSTQTAGMASETGETK